MDKETRNKEMEIKTETINITVQNKLLPEPHREYKDRVFRMIFIDKVDFLTLYNALNESSYDNPDELEVATLDNAIYMGMRNDVAYVLHERLSLYEHQSTVNPNMPLRNLLYVSDVYSGMTANANLYGSKQIKIPEPMFVVFYNGEAPLVERSVLKLSDMYSKTSEDPALELKTLVLNINPGYNEELKEHCKPLWGYMAFVNKVRTYQKIMPLKDAVEKTINECIEEGILADFLRKNRSEVLKMSLYEYDQERHIRMERADAREDGREEGRAEERINTERERQRADAAEAELEKLRRQLALCTK